MKNYFPLAFLCCTGFLASCSIGPSLTKRNLPDVLTANSGKKITTSTQWSSKRRAEVLELFRKNVYGRDPIGRPANLGFKVTKEEKEALSGKATLKEVALTYSNRRGKGQINLSIFLPNSCTEPVPAFLLIQHRRTRKQASAKVADKQTKDRLAVAENLIDHGYAFASFNTSDVGNVNNLYGQKPTPPDAWGVIAQWAWGAQRCMDYMVTDPRIDSSRISVIGHSRGGKAALWTGAQDTRFAMAVSNDSGCTGAALARGNTGESIATINEKFPQWFCANYKKYNNHPENLPVDQHALIALLAPRLVYIGSAQSDLWADPQAECLAGIAASPVYELFGHKGLQRRDWINFPFSSHEGRIGYHMRPGKHGLTKTDWEKYIAFADLHMGASCKTCVECNH